MTAPKASTSPPSPPALPPPSARGQSFASIAWRRFLRNRLAVGAFAVVILFASIAVWCPLLATDKPFYIRAIFHDSYDNSYYSALDLISRLERAGAQAPSPDSARPASLAGKTSPERGEQENAATIRLLENRLRDLEESVAPAARPAIASLRETAAKRLSGASQEEAALLRAELEKAAHPDRAPLIAQRRFPAFLAIGAIEVFFMILWIMAWAAALIAPLRRAGFRRLAMILFIPSLAGAITWRIANPPTHDLTTYRSIIEQPRAPVVFLRAPVPYGENENITAEANQPPPWFLPPAVRAASRHTHWLGTDPNGRDVLARMICGARISMLIGIVAVSIYVTIGIIAGAAAGYFRGWTDMILSRIIEIVICFPTLFLLLILLAYLRPNIYTIMAVLGLISWTGIARLERGEFLRLGNEDFVQAVRALGGGPLRIIFRHILPNALGPVLVSASFGIAGAILAESTLSFLGFGVPPDQASWGGLLKDGNDRIQELWWMVIFPGMALFTTVTCFNLVGEGVRDAADPRLIR